MEQKEIIHKSADPLKIVLIKTKSSYNWEIHISGQSIEEIEPQLRTINDVLIDGYGVRGFMR
jgi:uncharacterized membrane protein